MNTSTQRGRGLCTPAMPTPLIHRSVNRYAWYRRPSLVPCGRASSMISVKAGSRVIHRSCPQHGCVCSTGSKRGDAEAPAHLSQWTALVQGDLRSLGVWCFPFAQPGGSENASTLSFGQVKRANICSDADVKEYLCIQCVCACVRASAICGKCDPYSLPDVLPYPRFPSVNNHAS
jgi:hypothetical protein